MQAQKLNEWYKDPLEDDILLNRNAILIIHGIGEQFPLQTLGQFSQTFIKALNHQYKPDKKYPYRFIHRQASFELPDERELWLENYVSLEAKEGLPVFDIYEYYWAHKMTGQATIKDVVDWLLKASKNAKEFYKKRNKDPDCKKDIIKRQETEATLRNLFETNGEFHSNGYLQLFGKIGPLSRFLYFQFEQSILRRIPIVYSIYKYLKAKLEDKIVKYIGDAVVYTTTDRKMRHYDVRKEIIYDARQFIELLIKNPKYKSVFVAGHSLGSLIAYDVLTRIHKRPIPDAEKDQWDGVYKKIEGLFTFGSPLDKINLFFRELKKEDEELRIQMTKNIYNFKKEKRGADLVEDLTVKNLGDDEGNDVPWLNIYDGNDPVSGHLDLFKVDKQLNLKMKEDYGIAHIKYWEAEELYKHFLDFFNEKIVNSSAKSN